MSDDEDSWIREEEIRDVKSLSNVEQQKAQHSAGFIERLAKKQTEKSDLAFVNFRSAQGKLKNAFQDQTKHTVDNFLLVVKQRQQELNSLLQVDSVNESLLQLPVPHFDNMWKQIDGLIKGMQQEIQQLGIKLSEIEAKSKANMTTNLKFLHKELSMLKYPAQIDSYTPINEETFKFNLCLIRNRSYTIDLIATLSKECAVMRHVYRKAWTVALDKSKRYKFQKAIDIFKNELGGPDINNPTDRNALLSQFEKKSEVCHNKFVQQLQKVEGLAPPSVSEQHLVKWKDRIQAELKEQKVVHENSQSQLLVQEVELQKLVQAKIHNLTQSLKDLQLESMEVIQKLVNDECLPLVRQKEQERKDILFNCDQMMTYYDMVNKLACDGLSQFVDEAHNILLKYQQKARDVDMQMRTQYEKDRQAYEEDIVRLQAELDKVIQSMNSVTTLDNLSKDTNSAIELLFSMEQRYDKFVEQIADLKTQYHEWSLKELEGYEKELCNFFKVERERKDQSPPPIPTPKSSASTRSSKVKETPPPEEDPFVTLAGTRYVQKKAVIEEVSEDLPPVAINPSIITALKTASVDSRTRSSEGKPRTSQRKRVDAKKMAQVKEQAQSVVEAPKEDLSKTPSDQPVLPTFVVPKDPEGKPLLTISALTPKILQSVRRLVIWSYLNDLEDLYVNLKAAVASSFVIIDKELWTKKEEQVTWLKTARAQVDTVTATRKSWLQQLYSQFDVHKRNADLRITSISQQTKRFKVEMEVDLKDFISTQDVIRKEIAAANEKLRKLEQPPPPPEPKSHHDERPTKLHQLGLLVDMDDSPGSRQTRRRKSTKPPGTPGRHQDASHPGTPQKDVTREQLAAQALAREKEIAELITQIGAQIRKCTKTKTHWTIKMLGNIEKFKKLIQTSQQTMQQNNEDFAKKLKEVEGGEGVSAEELNNFRNNFNQFVGEMMSKYSTLFTEIDNLLRDHQEAAEKTAENLKIDKIPNPTKSPLQRSLDTSPTKSQSLVASFTAQETANNPSGKSPEKKRVVKRVTVAIPS